MLFALSCERPRVNNSKPIVCGKQFVCCYKTGKNSSVCVETKTEYSRPTFIYFKIRD